MLKKISVASLGLLISGSVLSAEHNVAQENKAFTVETLTVKLGDKVNFPNKDSIHHNVFSLSEVSTFDLGSYDKGESKSVTFDKVGTVEVECAIHPSMRMTIEVTE